jgi:hypothetical protein
MNISNIFGGRDITRWKRIRLTISAHFARVCTEINCKIRSRFTRISINGGTTISVNLSLIF